MTPTVQSEQPVFTDPEGPSQDAAPETIVEGFFDAMPAGAQTDGFDTARQFLTKTRLGTWQPQERTLVYVGSPTFVRRAVASNNASSGEMISVVTTVTVAGVVDEHGVFDASDYGSVKQLDYLLIKEDGQWRIYDMPDGTVISRSYFDQAYRQVTLYQLDTSGLMLVPDVRWVAWCDWRTQAVREVLGEAPAWLSGSVQHVNDVGVSLGQGGVELRNGVVWVNLDGPLLELDDGRRAVLVRQIRLALGDGSAEYSVRILCAGRDYSSEDAELALNVDELELTPLYTLSAGNVVALGTSVPLRVAQTAGYVDAKGFVFYPTGGAVLRSDNVVECLNSDGSSCGVAFNGVKMSAITRGPDGEVWSVSEDGTALYVRRDGEERSLRIDLQQARVRSLAVSPEGGRLALSLQYDDGSGKVVMIGVGRDPDMMPDALSDGQVVISTQSDIATMVFYNDITFIYASNTDTASLDGQHGYRQIGPGLELSQDLPDSGVVSIAVGKISGYRRLAVLDDLGIVRTVNGSLEGAWSAIDSQVTAVSSQ